MTQKRTRTVTFSRDNLIHMVTRNDFFEKHPVLASHKAEIDDCIKKYQDSAAAAGCGCRADTNLVANCLENLLAKLVELKETNPDAVIEFVKNVTGIQPRPDETLLLTVYFRKTGVSDAFKYEFEA